ncbi:hypothetical protein SBA4_4670011 [Candidatus Sulfopaludibacter sp. SbA4]|nr:hypothetical protein SBA4_4670011 [Candidatus Sulfopaludibacter sp. SbA4]
MSRRVALWRENWKEYGVVFPSEIGTPLDERNVLRRFHKRSEDNGPRNCGCTTCATPTPRFDL